MLEPPPIHLANRHFACSQRAAQFRRRGGASRCARTALLSRFAALPYVSVIRYTPTLIILRLLAIARTTRLIGHAGWSLVSTEFRLLGNRAGEVSVSKRPPTRSAGLTRTVG